MTPYCPGRGGGCVYIRLFSTFFQFTGLFIVSEKKSCVFRDNIAIVGNCRLSDNRVRIAFLKTVKKSGYTVFSSYPLCDLEFSFLNPLRYLNRPLGELVDF